MPLEVHRRRLVGAERPLGTVLDMIQGAGGLTVWADARTPPAAVRGADGSPAALKQTIGGAPVLTVPLGPVSIGAERVDAPPSDVEPDLLVGRDVAMTTRNGESVGIVADWLRWHRRHHGMTGACIVDRAPPGPDAEAFAAALESAAAAIEGLERIVLVTSPAPLGKPDLPAESHPFNAPAAPGKDRMDVPPPDPFAAPLGAGSLYEILRARFLGEAAAVLNVEMHDLVLPVPGSTVFDVARATGSVTLAGREAYPWRVRGDAATFGDHICVQFDDDTRRRRWCAVPDMMPEGAVWRMRRIGGGPQPAARVLPFVRHMALRHRGDTVSAIVPKTSLVDDPALIARAEREWGIKPIRPPRVEAGAAETGRICIVTCMKNEGPFILEWIAYHRAIGVDDFLVYTNDCTDGTDTLLALLQEKGIVQHRDNPFRGTGMKPQHAALDAAGGEEVVRRAGWLMSADVDEFINVKTGDGTLRALFDACPDANMFACTWRLFGNADIDDFDPAPVIAQFDRCAPEMARKPHQAWGFKTLYANRGIFKKMGVHRPKGLHPQLQPQIAWVNGSGAPLPKKMHRNAWRSTASTYGYDLVQLNHYAVRSAESFLVKRDRGRVNHVDRDQGLAYWFRMNNNAEEERSIQRMLPALEAEMARLLADPEIAAQHAACIDAHRAKIEALKARPEQRAFHAELTSERMRRLSRMHTHFGANVFLAGPEAVPDEIAMADHPPDFFFTVDRTEETAH